VSDSCENISDANDIHQQSSERSLNALLSRHAGEAQCTRQRFLIQDK
jgi:hypothetical protein